MMSSKKARKWLFTLLPLFALYAVKAKNPTAVCHYVSFYNPQQSSYIETYVTFIGNTFNFEKKAKDIYFSKAELTINLYQKDSLITGSKTIISSTPIADTAKVDNFIDVQRFALANGFYTIEYQVKDALDKNSKTITVQDTFSIHYTKQEVAFSGIELLEKYTPTVQVNILSKSGYDLVPYVADFYPENFNRLIYYAEIYNTNQRLDSTETLIQKATITSYETGAHLSNYSRFSKHKPKLVIVCLNEFNIAELPTGNYYLLIELINKNNIVLVSQKVFFQRLNP
ncbi:MAG: hypothetical protein IT239_03780, partial [Bacteroidia bacterium]|nr:hypothetical protein [Bacteroidia bacterium]